MNLSGHLGHWATAKAALAIAGALAVVGAIGSAVAFSPIIAPSIKWGGGAEFVRDTIGPETSGLFTVPAGRNLLLTDLVVSNTLANDVFFEIYTQVEGGCAGGTRTRRLGRTIVPTRTHTALAFQTGIGFASGQVVCVDTTGSLTITGRGFLFTAAPAS